LKPETVDRHRAIRSVMEELEAIDWYDQRIDATRNEELAAILAHNRDEEKEHAAMVLEWLRRNDPNLDRHLRDYLFTARPLLEHEQSPGATGAHEHESHAGDGSLGIGSLRGDGGR
jgi:ferritin-like protein